MDSPKFSPDEVAALKKLVDLNPHVLLFTESYEFVTRYNANPTMEVSLLQQHLLWRLKGKAELLVEHLPSVARLTMQDNS